MIVWSSLGSIFFVIVCKPDSTNNRGWLPEKYIEEVIVKRLKVVKYEESLTVKKEATKFRTDGMDHIPIANEY